MSIEISSIEKTHFDPVIVIILRRQCRVAYEFVQLRIFKKPAMIDCE